MVREWVWQAAWLVRKSVRILMVSEHRSLTLLSLLSLSASIYRYIPRVIKRLGLGMIFILLSILCTSVMDAYGHLSRHASVTECFLTNDPDYDSFLAMSLHLRSVLTPSYSLNVVGYVIVRL